MIVEKNGDILQSGADVICHQVNCRGVMGAGLAKQVRDQNPMVFAAYKDMCRVYGDAALGQVLYVPTDKTSSLPDEDRCYIANCFGQAGYSRYGRLTNYEALRACFITVRQFAQEYHLTVAIPYKIGCGLAGGDWDTVRRIIDEVFSGYDGEVQIWRYEP